MATKFRKGYRVQYRGVKEDPSALFFNVVSPSGLKLLKRKYKDVRVLGDTYY